MATNQAVIAASPSRVFEVLTDARAYGDWVVGSHSIRDVDDAWPAAGSRFHHRVGMGPLTVDDHTEVCEIDPPHRLLLQARARPLGTARVDLILTPHHQGTLVTMIESPGDPLSRLGINPLTDPLVHLRNTESLRRLKRIVETGVVHS